MACYLPWGCLFLVMCLLHSMFLSSSACFMEERAALMDIRSLLLSAKSEVPSSWGHGDDCCSWKRITCDNGTRRILRLDLSEIYYINYSDGSTSVGTIMDECRTLNLTIFSVFRELQLLDFSRNFACLQNFNDLQGLSKLKYLNLSDNSFIQGDISGSIRKLVSLEVINLSRNYMNGSLQNTGLNNLQNLRELHMGYNRLSGSLPVSVFALPRLEYLDLSDSNLSDNLFEGHIPFIKPSLNLRELHLEYNQLSGSLPASVFALPCLEYLDLSGNYFEGRIPINSSSKLRELHLTSNKLSGSIPASVFALPCLEYLDLSENLFEGHIPINSSRNCPSLLQTIKLSGNKLGGKFDFFWLRNCTELQEIDLSRNTDLVVLVKMHGWVPKFELVTLMLSRCNLDKSIIAEPHFLPTQHHLQFLDLSNNNLPGSMPNWLFTNEATLVYLNLSNNSLVGSLYPIWKNQTNLEVLNIALNHIEGQLSANISSMFPELMTLNVSHNNISGLVPSSLCNIVMIETMDLSNNKLAGEVPSCLFTDCSALETLKLSNNNLGGMILNGVSNLSFGVTIYLDNNKFEGTLPKNLSGNVRIMDLHDNKLSGEVDTSLWNLPSLEALSLASNGLTGGIHPGICKVTSLQLLDLSDNYFVGVIPHCSNTLTLQFLSISGNSLSGSPDAFFNSSFITALDLNRNQFTGNLEWTRYLSEISLLLLGRNKFEGHIPSNLCRLQHLSIIDLSHNRLSGSVPSCIGGILFGDPKAYENDWPGTGVPVIGLMSYVTSHYYPEYDGHYYLQGFTFTTKGNSYTYGRNFFMSMSGINLSANMLSGEIPKEMGNLSHIKSLNLSNNFFTGSITATFANMSQIESLDLSANMLNGSVPWQLTRLSSLEVFSVAYNNLSGCLPDSGQFGSFDMDCYKGNANLRSCTSSSSPVGRNGMAENAADDSDPILFVITAVSFVLAIWATVTFVFCYSFGQRVVLKL